MSPEQLLRLSERLSDAMIPSSTELLRVSEQLTNYMSKQLQLMQKATVDRTRGLGRPRDDNFDIVDMSLTCNDDTSENEEDSAEPRMYQLLGLEGVGELHSETENEREEVDIQEAARVVLDALDISDDEY